MPLAATTRLREVVSAWDAIPGGAAFGTLVHTVLEQLADTVRRRRRAPRWWPRRWRGSRPGSTPSALTAGLLAALATPLGALTDGRALTDVPRHGPAAGAGLRAAAGRRRRGRRTARVVLADLVPLWRAHVPTGPLSTYADALAGLPDVPLRGYLTGSIDAVLRVGSPAALPGGRLQDQPARRVRRAADRLALPVGRAGDRDDRGALPAAGAAVRRGAAPLPAVAAAGLRPGRAPRRRAVPVPARHVRAGRARRRRRGARVCSRGGRRPGWSSGCRTCWRVAHDRRRVVRRRRWRCARRRAAGATSTGPAS